MASKVELKDVRLTPGQVEVEATIYNRTHGGFVTFTFTYSEYDPALEPAKQNLIEALQARIEADLAYLSDRDAQVPSGGVKRA